MRNRWVQALAIVAGSVVALLAAAECVAFRYLWIDPRDVAGAQEMYSFGDIIYFLFLGGLFSLVPTLFLLRLLRAAEPFWRALSWACLPWAAAMPLAGVTYVAMVRGGLGGTALAVLLSAFMILRGFVSPASLAGLGLAWLMCGSWPTLRRRPAWSIALEMPALTAFGAWFMSAWRHVGR